MSDLVVRTSDPQWVADLTQAYRNRRTTRLIDDRALGVDPRSQTIASMGATAQLGMVEWKQVAGCAGVGVFGLAIFALAMLDPEPTSKLGLMLASGAFCVLTGAGGAIYLLTGLKPTSVEANGTTFTIRFN